MIKVLLAILLSLLSAVPVIADESTNTTKQKVVVIDMNMLILPGTAGYLRDGIKRATDEKAELLVVRLDTPGGILDTTQEMIQDIFKSEVPVVVYISPEGGTATSAGVFITMASHVAAMSPGTTIGAATPIMGDGKDIQGDLREKAVNITASMVKSITEQRGRNAKWAQEAVTKAASLTEKEALKENVVDIIATSLDDLFKQVAGKEVKLHSETKKIAKLESPEIILLEPSIQHRLTNFLANPSVIALLWLAATTGISIELYNPGLIFPGMVGVICLILALSMSSVIPISQGALLLLVLGVILIGLELFTGFLVFGIGGFIAIVIGALYLVDVSVAPGLSVAYEVVTPLAVIFGGILLFVAKEVGRVAGKKSIATGYNSLIGRSSKIISVKNSQNGKIFIDGEYWNVKSESAQLNLDGTVKIVATDGLTLIVEPE